MARKMLVGLFLFGWGISVGAADMHTSELWSIIASISIGLGASLIATAFDER